MRIRKVTLLKFRRFDNLVIDLSQSSAKVVALTGPNGCGKSSVFDAFQTVNDNLKGTSQRPEESFYSKAIFSDTPVTRFDKREAVSVERVEEPDQRFDLRSFYFRTAHRYSAQFRVKSISEVPNPLHDSGRPGTSIAIDSRIEENVRRIFGQYLEAFERGDKTGSEVVKELLNRLNPALSSVLDITISKFGSVTQGDGQPYFTKGNSKHFPFENLSSGEKEVVDLLLDIVSKSSEFNDTAYCIDEPELHLNTAIQRKLLIEMEKLLPDKCQLWLATHSIGFLRAIQSDLKDKATIIDFTDRNFDEKVVIYPMQRSRQNFRKLFRTALDDLSELISPEVIIYCEGRKEPTATNEEQGLDALIYNSIFQEEFPNALFVSSGGHTEQEKFAGVALQVLNKAFQNVTILLLKDRDIHGSGSLTTQGDRDKWLRENKSRGRMLSRTEIENYLFSIEILKKYSPGTPEEKFVSLLGEPQRDDVKVKSSELMALLGLVKDVSKAEFKKQLGKLITRDTKTYAELRKDIFG